jgi:hypothetical protein
MGLVRTIDYFFERFWGCLQYRAFAGAPESSHDGS